MNKLFKILLIVIILLASSAIILALILMFRVKLLIDSYPQGAEITINQKKYQSPSSIKLWPGQYEILAASGESKQQKTVEVKSKQELYLYFDFDPQPIEFSATDNPLAPSEQTGKNINVEQDHFLIEGPDLIGGYKITLNAIFNAGVNGPPIEEQEKRYREELKTYKQEALNWLKQRNFDPDKMNINWIPTEAENY